MKKRFSLKKKFILIFGILIAAAAVIEIVLAVVIARKAVTEKIEDHLIDKANDTAEIINGRVTSLLQFIEGISRMPILRDTTASPAAKLAFLANEVSFNEKIIELNMTDAQGQCLLADGSVLSVVNRDWFRAAIEGKSFFSEPYISRANGQLINTLSVPVYDDNKTIVGVLSADISGLFLSQNIADIVVGKTGNCYIMGSTGIIIADRDTDLVQSQDNIIEQAKTNPSLASTAAFLQYVLDSNEGEVCYYDYQGVDYIASFSAVKTTHWSIVIRAPVNEFMGTINTLRNTMIGIGISVLIGALIIVYFVARTMVKPIQTTVSTLQNISQGDGDLTVRLPVGGNDEITDMSEYFNKTIDKIGTSIRTVGINSHTMEEIGNELASNMTETASAVNQISTNIDGVKQQALTQAASVTETAATVEEIVRTIKQLNTSIENQASSVARSSASVEQMVANIASISQTLGKTDSVIGNLTTATGDGKATLVTSNTVTQKIAEESGSLMEASSVIQHIASQTNLLAMNAAIEAAHAGEAGKGFAVVADEIRKLAEESSMQGKTITATLKNLSGEIEMLSSSSKTVEEKFNTIFNFAEQVKEMSNSVTEAMREQENGSREVLTAIKDINMITAEVQAGSEEMLKGGESVAEEMRKLDELTRNITDNMTEMASGAVQINNAVQEVSEITQKNKHSIENLAKEVSKFKV
ncbi:methyl-accepting chemotaxis protein [Treponema sp. OMZ 857]|uniref:methyl-accepting chemotaxis protein n=1 Tax=Treponema sp. OMZ 857 TaxID=1643513 RepID=UPI0020A5C260|nr:methyl-accepting chemotaxis protein [Treponema sp. OMZ 857]UTC42694.1 methyl-accepting chemotaxis protein [Treponema sp. OMZ 857]